jgi:hypothetical protein
MKTGERKSFLFSRADNVVYYKLYGYYSIYLPYLLLFILTLFFVPKSLLYIARLQEHEYGSCLDSLCRTDARYA